MDGSNVSWSGSVEMIHENLERLVDHTCDVGYAMESRAKKESLVDY